MRAGLAGQKEKEILVLKKANEELVSNANLQAEEKQRRLIGEELHDNINQLLAVTNIYLAIAINSEENRLENLLKTKTLLMNAMEEIRKLSKELTGPDLCQPLEQMLCNLVDSVQGVVPFYVRLDFQKEAAKLLSERRKHAIYRIIQEQLNNIIKYAKATAVSISVTCEAGAILLEVKDNGIGFNSATVSCGIGLKNMNSRSMVEDGIFSIETSPGSGCAINVRFPLLAAECAAA